MMKFLLAKHEKTVATLYPIDTDPETRTEITMVYSVTGDMAGDHVHVEMVGNFSSKPRRRRFRIDRLEVKWIEVDGTQTSHYVVATGKTVLSDDTISNASHGYRYWSAHNWNSVPAEIIELVEGMS